MATRRRTKKKYRIRKQKLLTDLDPNLQDVVLTARAGEAFDPSVTTRAEDGTVSVDVVAKLKDPRQPVPGLHVVTVIGQIVTGTAEVTQIEAVRKDPNVLSLKRGTRIRSELESSLPEIRGTQTQIGAVLPPGAVTDGAGVIVGVIDDGCDFRHLNFRDAARNTRLLFLWDQRGSQTETSPQPYGYGREFTREQVDAALKNGNPYQTLGYLPKRASHGTHVLDIAAGNGLGTGHPGVAPGADLIFVEAAPNDFREDESFGNSRHLIDAVDYIARKAQQLGRPAVINISLGTYGGPHDGSTLGEEAFDVLLEQRRDLAIVIAAGNARNIGGHAAGTVSSGAPRLLEWQIDPEDRTSNELEIWYGGDGELGVVLISPEGERLGPFDLGTTADVLAGNDRVGTIFHRRHDPNNGDNQVDILLRAGVTGSWRVELTRITGSGDFHAWIERDDDGQSSFAAADVVRGHTLGSISCGSHTLAVASYSATEPGFPISGFSAQGPTRDGKRKPELSAPGRNISAARSLSLRGQTTRSGTSMAAPHVAGLVALVMAASPTSLTSTEIREILIDNARRVGTGWHSRFGYGRIDAAASVADVVGAEVPVEAGFDTAARVSGNGFQPEILALLENAMNAAAATGTRLRIELEIEPK